jgi:hypothetical protein
MRYFPLKTIILCLVFTPFLYIATLNVYQKVLNQIYFQEIEDHSIGKTPLLLKGLISIEEQLTKNIHAFSKNDTMIQHLGLDLNVIVTTHNGKLLYPTFDNADALIKNFFEEENLEKTAKRNFEILNEGLKFSVRVNLNHGSRIANLILIGYFSFAILIVLIFYKIGSSRAKRDTKIKNTLIDDLQKEEQAHKKLLENMKKERQDLLETIKSLKTRYKEDKKKLKINEDVMFDEIVSLEAQLNSFNELKYKNDEEIKRLKVRIKKYERRKSSKSKRNQFGFIVKHFAVLYKEIEMNRKAISGFLALNDDQRIKAEECVLLLDRNPDRIIIKRKVFSGKKHNTSCLEVLFAYNGRLYFRKNENNKVEVLVIGTKNSQVKDMEFLHRS